MKISVLASALPAHIGSWINRGLFDNHTGKVVKAMKSFADFITDKY